jgi:hypothetical protein
MQAQPQMSAEAMAEQLGIDKKRIYVLRSQAKKKGWSSIVVTNGAVGMLEVNNEIASVAKPKTKKVKAKPADDVRVWQRYHKELSEKYALVCSELANSRALLNQAQDQLDQAKIMYLNSEAVVEYLEGKLAKTLG